jgi:hypothetical protein
VSYERLQFVITTLNIADRIACHCNIPGMASRKTAMGASNRMPSSVTIW